MSHANKQASKAGRSAARVGSGGLVGVRLSLTIAERDQLLAMVRDAANNPYDQDNEVQCSLCAKIERAMGHLNQ